MFCVDPLSILYTTAWGILCRPKIYRAGEKSALLLVIPQACVGEAQPEQDEAVDVARVDGKRVGPPLSQSGVTLEHLLEGITEQNLHGQASPGDESPVCHSRAGGNPGLRRTSF